MLGCTMLVCLFSLKKLVSWTSSYFTTQHFNEVREKKIAAIKSSNTKWAALVVTKISPQDASKITELSFEDLCRVLQSGEVSATQALQAYQYKAVKENAKHNFICEAVAEAEGIAAKLDALTAEERRSLPLFGVPISLKETYMLEGYDCTVGCVKLINKPMKETSSIVKMLVTQGAVPFIRTNIPQTCMSFDSVNPIYGTTSNPHDPLRSCGGSSGGEGAAIGACSSILGLGTDIGGSIRIPAAFCGIYSLKPTAGRLSFHSDVGVDYNGRIVTVTCGPMGRDVNSLIAAMKVLSMPESHLVDPFVPPIPFNEKELNSNKKLRVGCFFGFEPIEVCESSKRAVAMAEEALKKAGHEVVHWQPPNTMWALSQAYATNVFGDGGKVFVEAVQNDIWEDHIKDIIYLSMMPAWLKKFIASTIAPLIFPRYLINYLTSSSGSGTISNLWKDEAEIKEYRRMVVKEMEKQEIDAILCPSMPVPAMRIGECKDAVGVVVYTALFNVLNFPSGAVPITKVTTEDIEKDMVNFPTKDMWHKAIKKNLEGSKGLPVGVQCASLPFYEERCLRMMKDLEKQIGYDVLIEYQN